MPYSRRNQWWKKSPADCRVCNHTSRSFIEDELLDGIDPFKVAQNYHLPFKEVRYHFLVHMKDDLIDEVRRLHDGLNILI